MKPTHPKAKGSKAGDQHAAADGQSTVVWVFDTEATGECCPSIMDLGRDTYRVVDVNAADPASVDAGPIKGYGAALDAALACRRAFVERAALEQREQRNWMFGSATQQIH